MTMRPAACHAALVLLGAASLSLGCNYGLSGGGGFPSHIRTIYVEPFRNETPQFDLEQQIFALLQEQLPRSLGVRPAGPEFADAILRGRITRYDDVASYQGGQTGQGGQGGQGFGELEHEVRIGIAAEIVDVQRNVILWESQSMSGRGVYRPGDGSDRIGREAAIGHLVQEIIDGAQSQW